MPAFGSLESQEVREYWSHEARDFTPWLANEIRADITSELEDTLGLDLEVIEEEKSVGRYNVDIVAQVADDNRQVVIENQLGSSDHDHLGKSIAYASGVDADIIVWIAPKFNDEHQDAMQWLNENSREGVDLFAIRLEVWKIDDSKPAVRLNPVTEPSEWKEKARRPEGELSRTKQLQEEYWTEFRNRIEESDSVLSARKPKPQHWYNNPIGKSGYTLQFTTNTVENNLYVQLIIRDDAEAYQELESEQEQIESEIGEELLWRPPEEAQRDNSNRSKITLRRSGNLSDQNRWDEYFDWMLENGERFHEVFYDRIQEF
ncbi:DUF4268 domain-containing protein [Halobium salinum]|uniref:DUF4268 domain-containing protein n=1 Tax=Halobium salinum TaxID=1364940 RepID=A0ABD5PAU2_9EURY|nr:DUF4268 domain-containing protein [Halobium salinum]